MASGVAWLIVFFGYIVFGGLAYGTVIARGADVFGLFGTSAVNSVVDGGGVLYEATRPYSIMSFGQWFALVIILMLFLATFFVLRAVGVKLVFASYKVHVPFGGCLWMTAMAYVLFLPLLATVLLVVLFPTIVFGTIAGFILFFGSFFAVVAGEIILYLAMTRSVTLNREVIAAHVGYSTGWYATCWLIAYLVILATTQTATY